MMRRFAFWSFLVASCGTASLAVAADPAGQPVPLAWDANPESTVVGYIVYVGTSAGSYSQTFDVGNTTTFSYTQGVGGRRHYFSVAAYGPGFATGPRSNEVSKMVAVAPGGSGTGTSTGTGTTTGPGTGTDTGTDTSTGGTSTGTGSGESSGGGTASGGSTGGGSATGSTSPGSTAGGGSSSGGSASGPTNPSTGGSVTQAPTTDGIVMQHPVINGSTVVLSWAAVGRGDVVEYMLEAGSASGLSNLFNGSMGGQRNVSARVSPGAYFVRVRARTSARGVITSNEVSFSTGQPGSTASSGSGNNATGAGAAGCTAPPAPPTELTGSVAGGRAAVEWMAAGGAISYVVQAGSAPGFSDVFHGNVGGVTTVAAAVGAGFIAHVRVVAVNACGQSAASAEILLQ